MTRFMVQEGLPGGCVDGWVTAVKMERTLKAEPSSLTQPGSQGHEGTMILLGTQLPPTCALRTHPRPPSSETHRPEGEPQWTPPKGHSKANKSREWEVIPRSDFQTAFPKEPCLEGRCHLLKFALSRAFCLFYKMADTHETQLGTVVLLRNTAALNLKSSMRNPFQRAVALPRWPLCPTGWRGRRGSGRGKGSFWCHWREPPPLPSPAEAFDPLCSVGGGRREEGRHHMCGHSSLRRGRPAPFCTVEQQTKGR